jgi:hypothetical protein
MGYNDRERPSQPSVALKEEIHMHSIRHVCLITIGLVFDKAIMIFIVL